MLLASNMMHDVVRNPPACGNPCPGLFAASAVPAPCLNEEYAVSQARTSGKPSSANPSIGRNRTVRDVVFVDGVRTPFGRAGDKGIYAGTRADDLVVKCIRELMRRNPSLPADRIDEVAIAATTQTGDQGLTIGRTAALLAGLPRTVPGFAIDRMCAGAMTAVTTTASG